MPTDLLRLPDAVNRCLLGCARHLRANPGLLRDPDRRRKELCPDCGRALRHLKGA